MNINSRVFGSDIPDLLKRKLEARQFVAGSGSFNPHDPVNSQYFDPSYQYDELIQNDFKGEADLSSRTPFVRMWTCLELVKQTDPSKDEGWQKLEVNSSTFISLENAKRKKRALDKTDLSTWEQIYGHGNVKVVSKLEQDSNGKHVVSWWYQTRQTITSAEGYDKKIYVVNSNNMSMQEGSYTDKISSDRGQVNTAAKNKALKKTDQSILDSVNQNQLFPDEHRTAHIKYDDDGTPQIIEENNRYLKPQAGITTCQSSTEGTLGVIRRTTVTFTVNNFEDFDKIYNRYFLRPGAQIVVDYGWSSIQDDLYDPEDIMDKSKTYNGVEGNVFDKIFADKNSFMATNLGDVDTLIGIVTEYDSAINQNGGVDCSVTITSKNAAMLNTTTGMDTQDHLIARIRYLIDYVVFVEAYYRGLDEHEREFFTTLVPGLDSSTSTRNVFDNKIKALVHNSKLANKDLTPTLHNLSNI